MTLKFKLGRYFCITHLPTKLHQSFKSYHVDKQTHKEMLLKTYTPLPYAMPVAKKYSWQGQHTVHGSPPLTADIDGHNIGCQGRRQVKKRRVDTHDECTEREPITGSAVVRGSARQTPPKAENLFSFWCPTVAANLLYSPYLVKLQTMTDPNPSPPSKNSLYCMNLRNDLWQKWGGHVHPSLPVATSLLAIVFNHQHCPKSMWPNSHQQLLNGREIFT